MQAKYKWTFKYNKKPTSIKDAARAIALARNLQSGDNCELDLGLKQLGVAKDLIGAACKEKKRFSIFGDYDVDGATSALICAESIRSAGGIVCSLASSKRSEGYGLSEQAVERINSDSPDLVILTDLGSNTPALVDGIKCPVVCIDHHRCDFTSNFTLLNPNNAVEDSGAKSLCSAGLAHALMAETLGTTNEQLALAALGTLADMSELSGYNYVMVREGLTALSRTARPGLQWMLSQIHVYGRQLTGEEISWKIVPPINSPGRIGDAATAIKALSLRDDSEVVNAARKCWDLNSERKYITDTAYQYALQVAEEQGDGKFILVSSSTFHRGTVGLIAGRLVRALNRPVGVGAIEGNRCTFSFRSVPGVDLIDFLKQVPELKGAGGHGQAGGGRCNAPDVKVIRDRLCELLEGVELPVPELDIEFPYPANEFSLLDVGEVDKVLFPYGQGNRRPTFCSRMCEVVAVKGMSKGQKITFKPRVGKEAEFQALSFDIPVGVIRKGQVLDVAYTAEISRWRGEAELCFMVRDVRECEGK